MCYSEVVRVMNRAACENGWWKVSCNQFGQESWHMRNSSPTHMAHTSKGQVNIQQAQVKKEGQVALLRRRAADGGYGKQVVNLHFGMCPFLNMDTILFPGLCQTQSMVYDKAQDFVFSPWGTEQLLIWLKASRNHGIMGQIMTPKEHRS